MIVINSAPCGACPLTRPCYGHCGQCIFSAPPKLDHEILTRCLNTSYPTLCIRTIPCRIGMDARPLSSEPRLRVGLAREIRAWWHTGEEKRGALTSPTGDGPEPPLHHTVSRIPLKAWKATSPPRLTQIGAGVACHAQRWPIASS